MKKYLAFLLAVLTVLLLTACGGEAAPAEVPTAEGTAKFTVGVCLPGMDPDWAAQGEKLAQIPDCNVLVEYAAGDVQLQQMQMHTLISRPVDCLVVAAVDSIALNQELKEAKAAGIPVVAYDRMLTGTDAAVACVAEDAREKGRMAAKYIVEKEQLDAAASPVYIELFMGAPEDHNALLFYEGVMEVLSPYLQKGVLTTKTGRVTFEDTCVFGGSEDSAWDSFMDYLSEYYSETAPDIICAASDAIAEGCIRALESFSYEPGEGWPLITGAGMTDNGVVRIESQQLALTFRTDTQLLMDTCIRVVQDVLAGNPVAGDTTRNNGMAEVPCYFITPEAIDGANYQNYIA